MKKVLPLSSTGPTELIGAMLGCFSIACCDAMFIHHPCGNHQNRAKQLVEGADEWLCDRLISGQFQQHKSSQVCPPSPTPDSSLLLLSYALPLTGLFSLSPQPLFCLFFPHIHLYVCLHKNFKTDKSHWHPLQQLLLKMLRKLHPPP